MLAPYLRCLVSYSFSLKGKLPTVGRGHPTRAQKFLAEGVCLMRLVVMTLLSGLACAQVSSSMAPVNPTSSIGTEGTSMSAQGGDITIDPNSLLPNVPAVPKGKATLVGGTISSLDRVRDLVVIKPFGGHDMKILFDGRTQIWRDGAKASGLDLKIGEKAYVDTILDGTTIFAKNIRVVSKGAFGESRGQIVEFDRSRSEVTLNDNLAANTFKVKIGPGTKIINGGKETSTNTLVAGTLVAVEFSPTADGVAAARQITVLAQPGTSFTFFGKVMYLDMHKGQLAIVDPRDKKNYDVYFNPSTVRINGDLQLDSEVTVNAAFDGSRYSTSAIMVNNSSN